MSRYLLSYSRLLFRLPLLLCLLLAVACSESADKQESTEDVLMEDPDWVDPESPKSQLDMLRVTVDNLRLRAKPNTQSAVMGGLKEGAWVVPVGTESEAYDSIELRGEWYHEPWLEIKYGDLQGWVFGGALARAERPTSDYLCKGGERVDLITPEITEADLRTLYGEASVTTKQIHWAEGTFERGSILYEGSSQEVAIFWEDTLKLARPAMVRITRNDGPFITPDKIKIGTSLQELQALNGKAFKLWGLAWDFGGYVISWEGGELDKVKDRNFQL
ncbi:MAG: hypothetical protein AAFP92_23515, partial [Bacteroidota bacterium]